MSAYVDVKSSTFSIKNNPAYRADPEKEFQHRLKTREHLAFIQSENLFDPRDPRWAKQTIDGEVCYGHEYQGCLLILKLQTADGKLNLTHNEDGTFDRHLLATPEAHTVYSITSKNNGLESTHTFNAINAGMASVPILCACLVLTINLANAFAAAQAAAAAAGTVATIFGQSTTVIPGVGIAIAVLGLIGVWIAYEAGREIVLNLIYENRSATKTLTLVDHYVYNIGDNPVAPGPLKPLRGEGDWEIYDDVVISLDNESKYRGIGVSLKFEKADGTGLVICIRQDIHLVPHYSIVSLSADEKTTAEEAYDNCTSGELNTDDFAWGSDLIVKNRLDAEGFGDYKFAGIVSFHDAP